MLLQNIGAMKTIQDFARLLVLPSLVVAPILFSLAPNQQFETIGDLTTTAWPSAIKGAGYACLYFFSMLAIESYFNTWMALAAQVCYSIFSQLLFAVFLLLLSLRNQIMFDYIDAWIALSLIWAFHARDVFRSHKSNIKTPSD